MNVEGDIKWIKAEMDFVKDPLLIETFKNLLNYRRKQVEVVSVDREMEQMMKEGLDDIRDGKVISTKELLRQVDTWK